MKCRLWISFLEKWGNGEGEVEKWRSGEVEKWGNGEVEKWRSGELIYGGGWSRTRIQKDGKEKFLFSPFAKRVRCPGVLGHLGPLRPSLLQTVQH